MVRVRSGLLASWTAAWLTLDVPFDAVVDAVTGDDEPHRVTGLPTGAVASDASAAVPLGWLLTELRARGARSAWLVLPVPGDPRGLPGPGAFTDAALAAGEGVLAGGLGVVPDVTRHGSAVGSTTVRVVWTVHDVAEPTPDPLTVAEAEHDLQEALGAGAAELSRLDAASWRRDIGGELERVRRTTSPLLPPGTDARAVRLLAQADRLAEVLALADADAPGGAVTGWEAGRRDEALRPVRTAARRARLAAYNAVAARHA